MLSNFTLASIPTPNLKLGACTCVRPLTFLIENLKRNLLTQSLNTKTEEVVDWITRPPPVSVGPDIFYLLIKWQFFFFFSYACRNHKTLTTCNVRPYIYIYICWTTSKRKAAETLDMKNVEPKFWNLARKASWKVKQFDRFMGRVEFWHKIMGFDRVALFE
jgi:hypothetical protein